MKTSPPDNQEILDRLSYKEEDESDEKIAKRWNIWNEFQSKVEENYQDQLLKLNTEDFTLEEVTTQICEIIQNPIFDQ